MSQDNINLASAISIADIAAHPAEAIAALIETMRRQGEQIAHLEENQEIQAGIIAKLKSQMGHEPSAFQQDRGEVLLALLAAHNGKMLAKDARHKMRLSETIFSRLLATLRNEIEVRPLHANRRYHLLGLRSVKEG